MEQEMVDARGSMSLQLSEYLEVPEPPEPLTPRRWQRLERFGEISIGSVGHPNSCALPCKFFRRARGCKDGKNCPRCHVCAWRAVYKRVVKHRDTLDKDETESAHSSTAPPSVLSNSEQGPAIDRRPTGAHGLGLCLSAGSSSDPMKISSEPPAANWSLGSVGHPVSCAQACKYRNRKGGCRDGRQCLSCHLCQWSRTAPPKQVQPQPSQPAYSPGLQLIGAVSPSDTGKRTSGKPGKGKPGAAEPQAMGVPWPMASLDSWPAERWHFMTSGEVVLPSGYNLESL